MKNYNTAEIRKQAKRQERIESVFNMSEGIGIIITAMGNFKDEDQLIKYIDGIFDDKDNKEYFCDDVDATENETLIDIKKKEKVQFMKNCITNTIRIINVECKKATTKP